MKSPHSNPQLDPQHSRELLDAVILISSDLDLEVVLHHLTETAVSLTKARYGALGVLDKDKKALSNFITVGIDAKTYQAIGALPAGKGVLGKLITEPKPLRIANLSSHPDHYGFPKEHPNMTSFLGVPIRIRDEVFGNLYLADKLDADGFSDDDEEVVVTLSKAAAISIDNARLYARVKELAMAEDRERIARDLHDTVIQKIFAIGLSLQSLINQLEPPDLAMRIQDIVDELDETIAQIRTTIFALSDNKTPGSIRNEIVRLVQDASVNLGFMPEISIDGPIDSYIDQEVGDNLLATLSEALSNIVKHAHASKASVTVTIGKDIMLKVQDNGCGLAKNATTRGNGLANMYNRAVKLSGEFTTGPLDFNYHSLNYGDLDHSGTELTWKVPAKR